MKKLLLLLLLIPNLVMGENKTCFAYVRDYDWDNARKFDNTIKADCKAGMVLDFRVYKTVKYTSDDWYDLLAVRKTKFCNYNKEITASDNDFFVGFTCEVVK